MSVASIRVHDMEQDGAAFYGYGSGEFKVNSTNAMLQSASHINNANHGWTVSGTDIQGNGFTTTLPALFSNSNSEIVNSGAWVVEWTGTGTSEQTQSPPSAAITQGDQVDYGVWVYLESSGGARNIQVSVQSWTAADAFLQQEGSASISVTPGEWTLLTDSDTVSNASAAKARVVIDQNGNQLVGDKLYVGMAFINVNKNDTTPRPSTLMDERFKLSMTVQQIGGTNNSGTIAQSLSGGWQINAAYSAGRSILTYVNNVGGNAYNVPTGIELDIERTYTLEILHIYSTGLFELAFVESGQRNVVYSTTLTTTTGDPALDSYGLDIMPNNWGILYRLAIYDNIGTLIEAPPFKNSGVYNGGTTSLGTPVSTTQSAAAKNNLVFDYDMFEVSRNFTGTVGFSIAKADRASIDFTGSFFVACSLQTRNDAAVDIVSSHSGTQGWRLSSVAGTSPAQQWEFVADDGTGSVSQTVATTINDGTYHFIGVERDSGVDFNLYSDDLDTAAHTVADGLGSLNGATTLDILSEWQGGFGALVVFARTLTEDERLDLNGWFSYGATHQGKPDVVDDAVLYINPSADIQKAAILDHRLVNLSHRPHDTLWVRYGLTTTDGTANPSLSRVHLEIPHAAHAAKTGDADLFSQGMLTEKSMGPLEWQSGWLFEKSGTNNIRTEHSPTERELEQQGLTLLTLFTKNENGVIVTDGDENIFEDVSWRLYYENDTNDIIFEQDSITHSTTAQTLSPGTTYLIGLKIVAGTVEITVDGSVLTSFAHNFTNVGSDGIEFGGSGNKRLHAVVHMTAIFDRYLQTEEEAEIMALLESTPEFTETMAVSESFEYVELNWG